MRRIATRYTLLLSGVAWSLALGCHSAGVRFLNLIGLEKRPLSIALVADQPTEAVAEALNPFPAYAPLQNALAGELGRPVAVDVCFPFQVDSGLSSGWYDLAVVTPAQYAALPTTAGSRVLAVPVDEQKRAARRAVLIVPAGADMQAINELSGHSVAFGPAGDSRTHYAALQLLEDGGLQRSDLALEILPVPGALKHLPDAHAVLHDVLSGGAAAGFVDEAAWDDWLEQQAREGEPARNQLRVLARTSPLPDALLLVSPKLDAATADRVYAFLLAVGTAHPDVAKPLHVSGYQAPTPELLAACRSLASVVGAPRREAGAAVGVSTSEAR